MAVPSSISCVWNKLIDRMYSDVERGGVHEIHVYCSHGASLIVNQAGYLNICLNITVGARTEELASFGSSQKDWQSIRQIAQGWMPERHQGTQYSEFFLYPDLNSVKKLAALVLSIESLDTFHKQWLTESFTTSEPKPKVNSKKSV
jgi:hypothetical protein